MVNRNTPFAELASESGCDGFLISSYENIRYFSGYKGFSATEQDAFLLISADTIYLFTTSLYVEEVKRQTTNLIITPFSGLQELSELLTGIIKEKKLTKIGYETGDITVQEWKLLCNRNYPNIGVSLQTIRQYKKSSEIDLIAQACAISDKALSNSIPALKPGISEKQFQFILEQEMRIVGADIAFPTIVAFGKNSAIPHHLTDDTKLTKNDIILIDFGARIEDYNADMTRTLFVGKTPPPIQSMYNDVLSSQQRAIAYIKRLLEKNETIYASDVDAVARDYLISSGYPSIPHSLGHGIGLAVHETPSISPNSKERLSEGMVFSIEPGIYRTDIGGIRIEDLYTIQQGSLRQLTHFPSVLTTL